MKRILSLIPVLFVVAVVVFLLVHLAPGDPVSMILGPEATPDQIEALQKELGLDRPLIQQFIDWILGVVRGDLGESIFLKKPVFDIFFDYLGPTISLAVLAQVIAVVFAIPLGILAARRKGTSVDQTVMGISVFGISLPSFLLGMFLIMIFAVQLRWFPVAGYQPIGNGLWNHLRFLILPAVALGCMQAALITRITRSSMLDVLSSNYIKTARSKGLKERVVVYKHALRNAFVTILEIIGQSFAALITGAVVVEAVFNIPGLGQLIVNSVQRRDFVLIQGIVLIIALMHVLINLIVDLLYGIVDPRVRLSKK